MPVYRAKNENFFAEGNSCMAYVVGFFTADGNMLRNRRGAHFISIEITDKELLEDIRAALQSEHKIKVRNRGPRWKTIYRLQIGSKRIYTDLERIGLTPNKSKTVKFPNLPNEFISDYVRGYFDGDGCVHLGKYWRKDRKSWKWQFSVNFTSGSRDYLSGLWAALSNVVKGGHISKKDRGYELVFGSRDALALHDFMYHNSAAEMFLSRKKEIFKQALQKMRS